MTAQAGSASSSSGSVPTLAMPARAELRRLLRARRQAMSPAERALASRRIASTLWRKGLVRRGQRVAVYLGMPGEVDLASVIAHAQSSGCHLYLPRIVSLRSGRMEFRRFTRRSALVRNRLGILEPSRDARRIAPRSLDRVLVPLLGFDPAGHRLGLGAGFYDRRFAFLRVGRRWRRPRLIGVAYELQKLPHLEQQPWDVPLDAIVTERRIYRRSHS